jgi:selenocysteine-specific elongation factor
MKDKRHYIIGTAGHVDHGKTALVRALTGMETDRLAEEKKRGLSIELGFAYMTVASGASVKEDFLRDNIVAFIDVPGHERFIRSMLAGVGSIDIALFCVAADDGVMPQTREHLDILHLLGLERAIIVVTKADLATSRRLEDVRAELEEILKGTTLEGSPIIEVSAQKGQGIDELKELIFSELGAVAAPAKAGAARLPIDRVFSIKGYGAVVTGTLVSGVLKVNDELTLFTDKGLAQATLRVRGIESHNQKVETVGRGQRVAVNLSGLSHHDIPRGGVLVASGLAAKVGAVTKLDCVIELAPCAKATLKDRCRLKLYHFASERNVVLQLGKGRVDERRIYGRLHIDKPLQVQIGDRFILRDPSIRTTVGGGVVLMQYPTPQLTPRLKELDLEGLSQGRSRQVVSAMVRKRGYGLAPDVLGAILDMETNAFTDFIEADGGLVVFNDVVLVREDLECIRKSVLDELHGYHSQKPGDVGMRLEDIRAAIKISIGRGSALSIVDGLLEAGFLDDMTKAGLLRASRSGYSLASHQAEMTGPDKELERVVMALFEGNLKRVTIAEIEVLFTSEKEMKRILSGITSRGDVVKLKDGVFVKASELAIAREHLEAHLKARGSIRVAEMRDLIGCGRRLAIEILEYFDKERVTLRKGDERVLR